jgi:hypothetical protein
MESDHDLISLFEHDLFGKPVPTFPDHALKKKAAWFPKRPFLSYGGSTLTGDFRTSAPGAYFPAVSYSVAAANRGSRELLPEPTRWSPISVR